jgi:putative transcriptional regulator
MTMDVLFERIDLKLGEVAGERAASEPIMFGGPVQDDRGFVLHTPGRRYSSSLTVTDEVAFTTSIDVLEAVAKGNGPKRMLVSIGYAGWSPGQLEEEISRNGWLTVGADARVLFEVAVEERYNAAIKLLGIDPLMLASEAGHA